MRGNGKGREKLMLIYMRRDDICLKFFFLKLDSIGKIFFVLVDKVEVENVVLFDNVWRR